LSAAYDLTELLRTAYWPFAYCVRPKTPLNTAYQKGGFTLISVTKTMEKLQQTVRDKMDKHYTKYTYINTTAVHYAFAIQFNSIQIQNLYFHHYLLNTVRVSFPFRKVIFLIVFFSQESSNIEPHPIS